MSAATGYGHGDIWRIAAPMILSALSTPLVGLVDTALMGHLDKPAFLAATAAGATVFSVLFMSLNFLRMGTTGVAAQAFGANSKPRIAASLLQPLGIALLVAILLLLLQDSMLDAALALISLSPESAGYAREYFAIRIWSAPLALANFVLLGWLIGMQSGRGPLLIILTINLVNILLDVLFVEGLSMDIRGVALATVCAELAGAIVGLVLTRRVFAQFGLRLSHVRAAGLSQITRLLGINGYLFVRSLALMFTFAYITAQGALFGDVTLAANALLMNFQLLLSYALDGIAYAAEALTGKAAGARNARGMQLAVNRSLAWTLLLALGFTAVYALGGQACIKLLTDLPEIIATTRVYLPWLVVLPLLSAGAFLYDGVFVGTTRSREMCITMVLAVSLIFMPLWLLLRDTLGNHALWLAFAAFMTVRSIGMHLWFRRLAASGQLLV